MIIINIIWYSLPDENISYHADTFDDVGKKPLSYQRSIMDYVNFTIYRIKKTQL